MKPFRRQEIWDLFAENSTSLMIIYIFINILALSNTVKPQPPSHRSFVPPRPLHSRWRTASCEEKLESLARLGALGSRVRVGTSVDVSTCIFSTIFRIARGGLELPLHARALHLVIPGRFVPVWRELMQP